MSTPDEIKHDRQAERYQEYEAPAKVQVTKAGLVRDMDDETYHGDPVPGGSLSSTFARLLTEHVPAKALARRKRPPTKSMNLGKAAHRHALGTGPLLIVWEHDGRTKAGKEERALWADEIANERAVAVTEQEREQIHEMGAALRSDEHVREILESCESEVSAFWQDGDAWMRARYDLLGANYAYDYKTCEDASQRGFAKALGNWSYHQQADFYLRGLRWLRHPAAANPMRFICQEKTAPYLVQIHEPDEEAMEAARVLNDRAIEIFARCNKTGVWPGYDRLINEPTSLPAFYFYDHADLLPDQGLGLEF